ncbi:disulfide bond formation protein B, partial [Acinetobacter baumannii]
VWSLAYFLLLLLVCLWQLFRFYPVFKTAKK